MMKKKTTRKESKTLAEKAEAMKDIGKQRVLRAFDFSKSNFVARERLREALENEELFKKLQKKTKIEPEKLKKLIREIIECESEKSFEPQIETEGPS